ncbi:MAG: hypothetical protein ACO20H_05810 [Bacteriovoracaceae bacterium]
MMRFIKMLVFVFLFSCAGEKPPPSGTIEELNKVNALVKAFEERLAIDIQHDDVLVGFKDGSIHIFLRTSSSGDYYKYIKLSDFEFIEDEFGVVIRDFIIDNTFPSFRYKLIMDTTLFGVVYDYEEYASSVESGTLFEIYQVTPKDLEKVGAVLEANKRNRVKKGLVLKYGLSAESSESISTLLFHFQKIQSRRSLTKRELDHFSKKLLGVDVKDFREASLDSELSSDLIEKVSQVHQTTPEVIVDILFELSLY